MGIDTDGQGNSYNKERDSKVDHWVLFNKVEQGGKTSSGIFAFRLVFTDNGLDIMRNKSSDNVFLSTDGKSMQLEAAGSELRNFNNGQFKLEYLITTEPTKK